MDKYETLNETAQHIDIALNTTFSITNEKQNFKKNLQLAKKNLEDIHKQLLIEIPENERANNTKLNIHKWRENLNDAVENIFTLIESIEKRMSHLPTDNDIVTGIQEMFKNVDRIHKKQFLIYNKEFDAYEQRINIVAENLHLIESQETDNFAIIQNLKDEIEIQIKKQNDAITKLTNTIKDCTHTCSHNNTPQRFSTSTLNNSLISHSTNAKPPLFYDNESDQPLRFLKDLKIYIEMFNINAPTDLIFTLKKCLLGKAKTWLHVVQDEITNFESFENQFKLAYWNKNVQNNVKWRIANGKFSKDGKNTRVQYATNIFAIAQDLGLSDNEIIPDLKTHFEREVKIHIRNSTSRQELFDILAKFDNDDKQSIKKKIRIVQK